MDTLNIGIVGMGRMARMFHLPCLDRIPNTHVAATCDLDAARRLPDTPHYTDVREMLQQQQLDVVYVLTPPGAHLEPVCLALGHGCHVFCEMPPALEPLETAQMASFARETERSLMFGANRHFAPTYLGVKEITRTEPPKMTVLTKSRQGREELLDEYATAIEAHCAATFALEGTPMFTALTQFIEVAEWLNGPILDCEATQSHLRPDMRTMTKTVAYLRHENGARSMITCDEFGRQTCEHVTLHSSASTYIVRGSMMQPNELLVWAADTQQVFPAPIDPQARGGFLAQAEYFIHCIQAQTPLYPDGTQLARIVHLARQVDGSAWWKEID